VEGPVSESAAFGALAQLYRAMGRLPRALRYEERALAASQRVDKAPLVYEHLEKLAKDHASVKNWGAAIACSKALQAHAYSQGVRSTALRCRLAAAERQSQRQRYEAAEMLVHLQRMAIIGRLIGQTQHALTAPVEEVNQLIHEVATEQDTAARCRLLERLNHSVDHASQLVSQLKLYSYRSAPQLYAVSLRDAVLAAWQGLAPHLGARRVDLDLPDDASVQAWADPQRLGILLKVLLLELTQGAGASRVQVCIDLAGLLTAQLRVTAAGAGMGAPGGADSLGVSLCREIATEMGGTLGVAALSAGAPTGSGAPASRPLCCTLQLPLVVGMGPPPPQAAHAGPAVETPP
jgi:C4-dicarboxylate-specific signal transduction histidine kinase